MKIGILTFHHALNCGAALQAWALQTFLRQQGLNAEIVNYGKIGWPKSMYHFNCDSVRHAIGSAYYNLKRFFLSTGIETYRRHLYRSFMCNRMHIGAFADSRAIDMMGYTHIIVGSDQVWNPKINRNDDTYFLANTADDVRRIAYAPSFGVDTFERDVELKMAVWLDRFDSISVREPGGARIIKRLIGKDAPVVCDPTLLMNVSDYDAIECNLPGLPEKYIAIYTIGSHPWLEQAAMEMGKLMGLPIVHLPGGQFARWYVGGKVKRITALGPSEWLWFIHHAEAVMTNSFHGTVFSLLYQRPFIVGLNVAASDERMINLLDGTRLEGRLLRNGLNCEILHNPIDWDKVDAVLMHKRENGKRFLQEAIG